MNVSKLENTQIVTILGAFAKLRKATISFVMSVRLSVRMEQLGSNWTDFHDTSYLSAFRKSVLKQRFTKIGQKWRFLCKKNNTHFLRYRAQFFVYWEMFRNKGTENIKTHILCSITFSEYRAVYEIMWKNIGKPGGSQMTIWRTRITCMIHKSTTNTHSEYLIFIVLLLQQWLHERTSVLRYTYIACLVPTIFFYGILQNLFHKTFSCVCTVISTNLSTTSRPKLACASICWHSSTRRS
jgi:hypothetical protein